jgi:hypothetical protein
MYTQFSRGRLWVFSKLNRNVIYGAYSDILSKDGTSHMNARATLSNGRTIKGNGGGAVVIRVTQDKFEVVLEVSKCVRSTKKVAALFCNGTSNTIKNCMHS